MCKRKYAVIASMEDETQMQKLIEFGRWFLPLVSAKTCDLGIMFEIEEQETVHYYAPVNDGVRVAEIYEDIFEKHPSVSLVIHILPFKDSIEYKWMKTLTARYGLIRQGILLENALNKFADLDREMVLGNVAQWIGREALKSSGLGKAAAMSEVSHDLTVKRIVDSNNDKENAETQIPRFNQALVSQSGQLLHDLTKEKNGTLADVDTATLSFDGFPLNVSKFSVGALFTPFIISDIRVDGTAASVTFVNKFHAFQAAQKFSELSFEGKPLKMTKISAELQQRLTPVA